LLPRPVVIRPVIVRPVVFRPVIVRPVVVIPVVVRPVVNRPVVTAPFLSGVPGMRSPRKLPKLIGGRTPVVDFADDTKVEELTEQAPALIMLSIKKVRII
jgi:hypothetical protein